MNQAKTEEEISLTDWEGESLAVSIEQEKDALMLHFFYEFTSLQSKIFVKLKYGGGWDGG